MANAIAQLYGSGADGTQGNPGGQVGPASTQANQPQQQPMSPLLIKTADGTDQSVPWTYHLTPGDTELPSPAPHSAVGTATP